MNYTVEELMHLSRNPIEQVPQHRNASRLCPILTQAQTQTQPSTFIDVHTFDYTYANNDHEPVLLSKEEKVQWLHALRNVMTNPVAQQGVHMIIMNIDHMANLDSTNQKTADDILVLLSKYVLEKDREILPLLEEQLQDMVELGQCAQGRTTRLWQLYKALE